MVVDEFRVKSFDGLELYCKTWHTDEEVQPKARLLFVHGFSEFIDSYDDWFALANENGYEVTSYDQRGHGLTAKTSKDFGVSSEKYVMGDLEVMADYVSKNYDGPLVLYGFSMGAAIVLNYMVIGKLRERFDLYISVAPYILTHPGTNKGLNAVKLMALPFISKIMPNYVDKADLKPSQLTNDSSKWDSYKNERLRHYQSSALFMQDAIVRGKRLLDPKFISIIVDRPLLLSQGTADTVCDPDASGKFIEKVRLTDKTLDLYDGLPHELMQCVDKNRLDHWTRVDNWLKAHLNKISTSDEHVKESSN
ncbi:acylglycerol lipase [Starmerella bacillaris]|uniref:Acylglycerol lipase n=1 Tax=Starmerella bacillaris TaxID=1247836 RepID=A0AAV5RKA0_STABA|nr:acylglycerol lipase [Starmerella bacillaris]